jgi:tetratricopeptide (TPR) repeat protein
MTFKNRAMSGGRWLLLTLVFSLLLLPATREASAKPVTFEKEYFYQAGDADSKLTSREIALEQTKRLLLEELGTFLLASTEVKDFQLTKDEIVTYTAGTVVTVIIQEKWDGATYYLKAKLTADPDQVTRSIDELRKDSEKSKELEEMRKKTDEAMTEIERLKKELARAKEDGGKRAEYERAVSALGAKDLLLQGIRLRKDGKNLEALESINKALAINPRLPAAYNIRGSVQFRLGATEEALRDFDRATELNPGYAAAYINKGNAYLKLRDFDRAGKSYERAIEIDPASGIGYYNRGILREKEKNYKEAIADFTTAIKLNYRGKSRAYNARGYCYTRLGKMKQAIMDFDSAIEADAANDSALYRRGMAHRKLGKREDSEADLKNAARLGNKRAQKQLKDKGIDFDDGAGD